MLLDVPTEIVRYICTYLAPESAFVFFQTCTFIRQACNDWILWRELVLHCSSFPRTLDLPPTYPKSVWKDLLITHIRVDKGMACQGLEAAVQHHLPRLIFVGYTGFGHLPTPPLLELCKRFVRANQCTYTDPYRHRRHDSHRLEQEYPIETPTSTWRTALGASLCLVATALSSDPSPLPNHDDSSLQLSNLHWPPISKTSEPSSQDLAIQYTLANTVIHCLATELQVARRQGCTIGEIFEGTAPLPSLRNIPFLDIMNPPLPDSSPSPLPRHSLTSSPLFPHHMTHTFFTRHPWTGFFASRGSWRATYHGIGGTNPLAARASLHIASTISFSLAKTQPHDAAFALRSNTFHTPAAIMSLRLHVQAKTGRVLMRVLQRHQGGGGRDRVDELHGEVDVEGEGDAGREREETEGEDWSGLITPFGLLCGRDGEWIWLWKGGWSGET